MIAQLIALLLFWQSGTSSALPDPPDPPTPTSVDFSLDDFASEDFG